MARRIEQVETSVSITVDGQTIAARDGDTIAAALIAVGERHIRDSVVSGEARGVYCMMGVCFECLMEVDGRPNVQACQTLVRDGMQIQRMTFSEAAQ